jgi:hypothetical protein
MMSSTWRRWRVLGQAVSAVVSRRIEAEVNGVTAKRLQGSRDVVLIICPFSFVNNIDHGSNMMHRHDNPIASSRVKTGLHTHATPSSL